MTNKLKEYANLLVRIGLNVQQGQHVNIFCPVDCAVLARACTEACYDAGAREVTVMWNDDQISRMKYLRASDDVFGEMPVWLKAFYDSALEKKCPHLAIVGDDPESMKGVDPSRIQRWRQTTGKVAIVNVGATVRIDTAPKIPVGRGVIGRSEPIPIPLYTVLNILHKFPVTIIPSGFLRFPFPKIPITENIFH